MLASPAGAYYNGVSFIIDGGWLLVSRSKLDSINELTSRTRLPMMSERSRFYDESGYISMSYSDVFTNALYVYLRFL